jgi:L-alanine-DL-glutamate epimerase-like enolase superfamily enzyme
MLRLATEAATLRLAQPFRIAGYVFETAEVLVVTLDDGTHQGRGEGAGAYYLGDDLSNMLSDVEAARAAIEAGPTRAQLRAVMPAGGARNAVDAALWEPSPSARTRPRRWRRWRAAMRRRARSR